MPRHYSPEDRDYALQRLIANSGDVARTAEELGLHPSTLYKWRKTANSAISFSSFSSPFSPQGSTKSLSVNGEGFREGLPADDLDSFQNIKAGMLHNVNLLIQAVPEAIAEATLGQRVTALIHLIDRIISLAAQLPQEDEDIEYVLTDDVEEEDEEEI